MWTWRYVAGDMRVVVGWLLAAAARHGHEVGAARWRTAGAGGVGKKVPHRSVCQAECSTTTAIHCSPLPVVGTAITSFR